MIETRKRFDRSSFFYHLNITASLVLLLFLSYALNSGLMGRFAMAFYGPKGLRVHGRSVLSHGLFEAVFVYGKDFLIGYSVFAAMALVFRDSLKDLLRALKWALLFEIGLEILLYILNPALPFYVKNLLAELLGTLASGLVILLCSRKLI